MNEEYHYMLKAFKHNYKLPNHLAENTQHPELNSSDFIHQVGSKYKEPKDFLPTFSHLDYRDGIFVVGTNHFSSIVFNGNVIATENFESIVKHDIKKTSLVIPENSTVTGLKFIDKNQFIVATINNRVNLWSSRSSFRDGNKPSSFNCGGLTVDGYVSSIDRLRGDYKFVTGSRKGCIAVFDYGISDLELNVNINCGSPITGVSAHPSSPKLFSSCSVDHSCLIWDLARKRPALTVLRNYEFQLTAVHWTKNIENFGLLMVGDEIGNLLTLDPRAPNKILQKTRVTNRGLTQISFHGCNEFGVIANNNVANILEIEANGDLKVVHKHVAPGIIYSMCWDKQDRKTFYLVGEKQYAEKITLA